MAALALLLLAVAAACGALWYRWLYSPLPQLDGEVRLNGLQAKASVRRDRHGVPYVTAENEEDLYFAQGYVMAQDRLWQMDLMRRAAGGRLSEIMGQRTLEADLRQRAYGFRRVAERAVRLLPPDQLAPLEAYARGINAYIDERRDNLPVEFRILRYEPEPWDVADSVVVGKLIAQTLASSWDRDIMRGSVLSQLDDLSRQYMTPEYSPEDLIVVGSDDGPAPSPLTPESASRPGGKASPAKARQISSRVERARKAPKPLADAARELAAANPKQVERDMLAALGLEAEMPGSNNWVISGARTTTGKPIMANDPHLGHGVPSTWYQMALSTGDGQINVAGVTFPGIPGVVIGHNGRISWGVTNAFLDVQDLYAEEFNPDNPYQYRVGTEWRDAEVVHEKVKVRRSTFGTAADEVEREVVITRHGPIITEQDGKKMALRWTALDDVCEFAAFRGLMRAANWDDFRAALREYRGPAQNFVYADADGNIGYYVAANVPVRGSGDGSVPYDGAADANDWRGYIPFDELPHVYNPPQGYVVTANNRTVGTSYKHFLNHEWYAPYRAKRIAQLIESKEKVSVEDAQAMQADVYSLVDVNFTREAKRILEDSPYRDDPTAREIIGQIDAWDGQLQPDSIVPTTLSLTRRKLTDAIYKAKLGTDFQNFKWFNQTTGVELMLRRQPPELLPADCSSYAELIIRSYNEAVSYLTDNLGTDRKQWNWSRANVTADFRHPLGVGPLGFLFDLDSQKMGGGTQTVNCNGGGWGVSMRLVVDMSDLDNTRQGVTTGQSGQIGSPFYSDQLADWHAARTPHFPFSETKVNEATVHRLTLAP